MQLCYYKRMKISLEPGVYILAISGGVDSVALLNLMARDERFTCIVAHFDHGIRTDSAADQRFVCELAKKYGLQYETERVDLGSDASEATARSHRYSFLHSIRSKHTATAIVTAHHMDDLIETAALNMLRGTKYRGLVSLRSTPVLRRPLLGHTKQELIDYAVKNRLEWVEDATNFEDTYTRNALRKKIQKHITPQKRSDIIGVLEKLRNTADEIDVIINEYLQTQTKKRLTKHDLQTFEATVAFEMVAAWLRLYDVPFDANAIVRIVNGSRTLRNGAQIDVQDGWFCTVRRHEIALSRRSSV